MKPNVIIAFPVVAVALLCLLAAPPADASIYKELQQAIRDHQAGVLEEVSFTKKQVSTANGLLAVKGKKERKQVRKANWYLSLQGDRLRVRETMGHPLYRYYELSMGVRTELWIYPAQDIIYVFQGGKLIDTHLD